MKDKWVFTDNMLPLSCGDMSQRYENVMHEMLRAGLQWCEDNPKADPKFHTYTGIMGICAEDNDDARELTAAILDAVIDDYMPSSAQHQMVIEQLFYIWEHGWDMYVDKRIEAKKTKEGNSGLSG